MECKIATVKFRGWIAAGLVIGLVPLFAANQAGKKDAANEDAETVYKRQCAGCHGADGAGKTAMGKVFKLRDLKSDEVQKMTDSELFDIIAKGKGKMPAYQNNLGHEKIHAVIVYLREMAKKK
jgi:mono/diheme cytochrome c family protein